MRRLGWAVLPCCGGPGVERVGFDLDGIALDAGVNLAVGIGRADSVGDRRRVDQADAAFVGFDVPGTGVTEYSGLALLGQHGITLPFSQQCVRVAAPEYGRPGQRRSMVEWWLPDKVQIRAILLLRGRSAKLAVASFLRELLNIFRRGLL